MRPRAALRWVRTPLTLDFFLGWSRAEERVWHIINRSVQAKAYKGRISVGAIAWFTGYSERQIYRILRRLKDRGAIYAIVTCGIGAVYYLPFEYCGPHTRTPDNQHVRGANAVNNKEKVDKYKEPHPRFGRREYRPYQRDDRTPVLAYNSYSPNDLECPTPEQFAKECLERTLARDRDRRASDPHVWRRPASWNPEGVAPKL